MVEFAAAAARLAGVAAVLLGWRPDAFWKATPAELAGAVQAMTGEQAEPVAPPDLRRLMEMFPDG